MYCGMRLVSLNKKQCPWTDVAKALIMVEQCMNGSRKSTIDIMYIFDCKVSLPFECESVRFVTCMTM